MKTLLSLCAAMAVASLAPCAAAEGWSYEEPDAARARDWRDIVGRLELGYRGVFVTNPGFNPFSTQDYFSGASLTLSHTLATRSHVSFAIGASWDYGTSKATSRGDDASLEVHRLTVPLEGRVHFGRWGYAFARVAPGAAFERAELDDPSAIGPLTKSRWLFATDASVGYAIPIVPIPDRPGRRARIWLQGDGGYSWVAAQHLDLEPSGSNSSATADDGVDLRSSLGLRGAFFRVAAAVSY